MSETNKLPVIRQDAQIPIVVGTAIIKRLQELGMSIISNRTEAEIDKLQELLNQNITTFNEPWMDQYYTVMMLLTGIERKAVELGLVDNLEVDEASQPDS